MKKKKKNGMGTGREIVRQFKTRKLQYLGHLIRHNSTRRVCVCACVRVCVSACVCE